MRTGFAIPQIGPAAGPSQVREIARRAEALGYDSLWVLDRLLYPLDPRERYPAAADGVLPEGYRRVLDPLALLSFAAAHTETIALGTSILNLAWYNPALLGRELATIDLLSGGRLRLGIGTGWCPEEFEAAGVAWETRGRRTDEALQVLRTLWSAPEPAHRGEFFSIPRCVVDLKPVQARVPVYMAAYTPAAMRRIAEQGDGWMPAGIPIPAMAQMFADMRRMAEAAGRPAGALQMIVRANVAVTPLPLEPDRPPFAGSLGQIRADIEATRGIGADELLFDPQFSPDVRGIADLLEMLEQLHALAGP